MGVFYHMGFGVAKNEEKSIDYLTKAAKVGNGQSCYELCEVYMSEGPHKDVKKAYHYLEKAL